MLPHERAETLTFCAAGQFGTMPMAGASGAATATAWLTSVAVKTAASTVRAA
jgi:hypothetical protein